MLIDLHALTFASGPLLWLVALLSLVAVGIVAGSAASGAPAGPAGPASSGGATGASETPADVIEIVRDEPSPQNAAGAEDADDVDAEDPNEDADLNFRDHPRFKALKNKARKLQRHLAKAKETAARFTGVNLDDLTFKSRNYDALEQRIAQNPKLRAFLEGGPEPTTGGARRSAEPSSDAFDDANFPFDPADPGGKFLLEQARTNHTLQGTLRQLTTRLERAEQDNRRLIEHLTGTQRTEIVGAWKSATDTAAAKLPEKIRINGTVMPLREMFRDTVYGAFQAAQSGGRSVTKELVNEVIKHYLGEFGLTKGTGTKAAAATQRTAEHATTIWPRTSALVGQGTPASAREGRGAENAHQAINRIFRGRRPAG
jgi:hypothetical protein